MPSKFSSRLSKYARYTCWANRSLLWVKSPKANNGNVRSVPIQAEVTGGQSGRPHLVNRAFGLAGNLASSTAIRLAGLALSLLTLAIIATNLVKSLRSLLALTVDLNNGQIIETRATGTPLNNSLGLWPSTALGRNPQARLSKGATLVF